MTDENLQDVSPAEGAPALPVEAEPAAPPTATDQATESPADDAGEDAKPRGVGKRIDELTRNWREAERREAALLALLSQRDAPAPPKAAEPAAPPKQPTLADYEYDEAKFLAANAEYNRAIARAEVEAALQAERERQAEEARRREWDQRTRDFVKSKPDYAEKVQDPTLPITATMAREIQGSELGPELAYYLAENRELAAQIAQMGEAAAIRAMGRLEGRLLAQKDAPKPAPPPKPAVSQAPPPPPKIEAVEPEVTKDPDAMSTTEWLKWRNKQLNRKRN